MSQSLVPKKKNLKFHTEMTHVSRDLKGVLPSIFSGIPRSGRKISPRWTTSQKLMLAQTHKWLFFGDFTQGPWNGTPNPLFWMINHHLSSFWHPFKGFLGTHFKGYLPGVPSQFHWFLLNPCDLHILHRYGSPKPSFLGAMTHILGGLQPSFFMDFGVQGYGMVYFLGF